MREEGLNHLGNVLLLTRPLSRAEGAAMLRWYPRATVFDIAALRKQRAGRLCLIKGGLHG